VLKALLDLKTASEEGSNNVEGILSSIKTDAQNQSDRNHEDLAGIKEDTEAMANYFTALKEKGEDTDNSLSNFYDSIGESTSGYNTIVSQIGALGALATGVAPTFQGSGQHVFSGTVYGQTVSIDLSFFADLKPFFDILFLLVLAYLNFKIYRYILEVLLKIGA